MNPTLRFINPGDFFILPCPGEKIILYNKVYRNATMGENTCVMFYPASPPTIGVVCFPDDLAVIPVMGRVSTEFSVIQEYAHLFQL